MTKVHRKTSHWINQLTSGTSLSNTQLPYLSTNPFWLTQASVLKLVKPLLSLVLQEVASPRLFNLSSAFMTLEWAEALTLTAQIWRKLLLRIYEKASDMLVRSLSWSWEPSEITCFTETRMQLRLSASMLWNRQMLDSSRSKKTVWTRSSAPPVSWTCQADKSKGLPSQER